MPNLSQIFKAEIVRISRKEIKLSVNPLRSSTNTLKKTVAELKKRIAVLETENKRYMALNKKQLSLPRVSPEDAKKARINSRGILKLRTKLGLSQDSFAKLLGVSSQAVYTMEHKGGKLKLRTATLSNLLAVREMGKREALRRLEEIEKE
jgi:DNA-binding transcriptional regulator YiaG